jgi:glycosyltransferase involved in cell wall biosynthesis
MKLSVLMPVYNESRTLRTIIGRVLTTPVEGDLEVVAVDDGSSDRSWEILSELAASDDRIVAIRLPENRGKGHAIRIAIEHMSGDIGVVQDSDLEYDPAELPRLIKPILDGRADAVFGSRFASSPERRVLLYWHSLGNKALTWLTNVLNDLNLTDMETCYKAIRADLLRSLRLRSDRFGIEPEITTRLAQLGARIYEVPISYHGRTYAEGKNIGWRDGIQAIWLLFKFRFLDTVATERVGHETLEYLGTAPSLARWILAQFTGFIGNRVLEAGCGIGNVSRLLLAKERLVLVDSDHYYVSRIEQRYGHLENISVLAGDLEDEALYRKLGHEHFDTVLCINVLEHLDDPEKTVAGFYETLVPQGHALALVPAHAWLFSAADRAMDHRRRFAGDDLEALFVRAGFEIVVRREFNRFSVIGWATNKALGRAAIPRWQVGLFRLVLPVARLVERIRFLPGLSWVIVARKP